MYFSSRSSEQPSFEIRKVWMSAVAPWYFFNQALSPDFSLFSDAYVWVTVQYLLSRILRPPVAFFRLIYAS